MSWDFYDVRTIKATRKDRQCVCCSIKIPKGSGCIYQSGKYDGDLVSQYVCHNCNNLYNEYANDMGNDYETWDEIYEYLREQLTYKHCEVCGHYYKEDGECNISKDSPMVRLRCTKEGAIGR
jgi:hypothetical protein